MFAVMIGGLTLGQSALSMFAFAKAIVVAANIFRIIDHKPGIDRNSESGMELDSAIGLIELKEVDFPYPSRPYFKILNNFSLNVPSGKTIALVGSSGSGKSTVVSLIERFYEPCSGKECKEKTYGNCATRAMPLFCYYLRKHSLWKRLRIRVRIIEAASLANAHNFISALPDGYKTYVGERGVQLSGGQKQRATIGRALARKAEIMLLVEATSALDSESERSVQEALDRACSGKTTIVVAHGLSTIQNAHVIAVIDDGKVAEQGSHSHLLKNYPDGIYARMIQLQSFTNTRVIGLTSGVNSSGWPRDEEQRKTSNENIWEKRANIL